MIPSGTVNHLDKAWIEQLVVKPGNSSSSPNASTAGSTTSVTGGKKK